MSAYDWAIVAAVCALTVTVLHYLNRGDDRQWRQSTGSDPQTVADDAAELRRQREIAQLEAWLHARPLPRNTIPHQTRWTEDNQ